MEWYHIFESDILTSYRILVNRIKKHPIITIFFIFIAFAGTRLAVYIGLYLDNLDMGEDPIYIERWVFSIIFFSFIFGKAALYTYRKVLKEREMLTIFSQPLEMYQIALGKYIANLVYVAVFLLIGFLLMYGWLVISLGLVGVPVDILIEGALLAILGLSLGFTLPIFLQLKPMSRKILNLASNIFIIGAVSIPVRYFPRNLGFYLILLLLTVISVALVFYSSRFLIAAWTTLLSKPLTSLTTPQMDRLLAAQPEQPWVSREAWLIAKKELISLIREKDAIVTIIAAIFLSVASVGIYYYYGPQGIEGSSLGIYLYPGILAVFLFLGTLMISALIGLAMISVEGRAFYIIKLLPVPNKDVLKGKSLALLILGFPIIVPMAFLLPIVAKFPIFITLFFIILAIVMIISYTGIGIWGGTRFPNFDATARNMPDLISQFFIMAVCVVCTFFIGGIPAYLMTIDYVLGFVAILVALGWAITIFICALDRGKGWYDTIGSDMYM